MRSRWWGAVGLAVMMLEMGCSDESNSPAAQAKAGSAATTTSPAPSAKAPAATGTTTPDTRTPEERIAAGRSTYNANCIACHAMDPRQDGALGPAVAGASLELLEARILRAEYPEGYSPKRATRAMVPIPHLAPKLAELEAYLGSLK